VGYKKQQHVTTEVKPRLLLVLDTTAGLDIMCWYMYRTVAIHIQYIDDMLIKLNYVYRNIVIFIHIFYFILIYIIAFIYTYISN